MLAALAKPQAFQSRSQLKTWLIGILKHKVIDKLRLLGRKISMSAEDDDGEDLLDVIGFKPDGHVVQPSAAPKSLGSSSCSWTN